MKPIHYLGLAVRIFALFLFVYSLAGIVQFFSLRATGVPYGSSFLAALVFNVLPIVLSIYLWFFPLTVAHTLLSKEDKEFEPINPKSLLTILIASIGLFFLYKAITDGVFWLSFHAVSSNETAYLTGMDGGDKAAIISTIIELVFALLLVAKCRSIAGLMARTAR